MFTLIYYITPNERIEDAVLAYDNSHFFAKEYEKKDEAIDQLKCEVEHLADDIRARGGSFSRSYTFAEGNEVVIDLSTGIRHHFYVLWTY